MVVRIGYAVDLSPLALGITPRRAAWCVGFLSLLSRDGRADVGHMRSGLGRLTDDGDADDGDGDALRHEVSWVAIDWLVMDWALELGTRFHAERKPDPERAGTAGPPSKRMIPLREAEPW